jgi:putative FmdB family regulatory protein
MPIYGYKCTECGHQFDKLQKMSDDPLKDCPECNKPALEKQLSTGTGFCLMGYGWHKGGMTASRSTGRG